MAATLNNQHIATDWETPHSIQLIFDKMKSFFQQTLGIAVKTDVPPKMYQ